MTDRGYENDKIYHRVCCMLLLFLNFECWLLQFAAEFLCSVQRTRNNCVTNRPRIYYKRTHYTGWPIFSFHRDIASYWSKVADFYLLHPHQSPRLGVWSRSNLIKIFDIRNWNPWAIVWRSIRLAVLVERRLVTNRQTNTDIDRHATTAPRGQSSRGKNLGLEIETVVVCNFGFVMETVIPTLQCL